MTPEKFNEEYVESLAKIFKALANPIRIKILALCLEKERTNKELREILKISKPLLITHLKPLIRNGFLEVRTEFDEENFIVRKYYRAKDFNLSLSKAFLRRVLKNTD